MGGRTREELRLYEDGVRVSEGDDSHLSLSQNRWKLLVSIRIASVASVRDLGSARAGGSMVFAGWTRHSGPSAGVVGRGVYLIRDLSIEEQSREFPEEIGDTCCFTLLLERVFRGRLGLVVLMAELRQGRSGCVFGTFDSEA